MTVETSKQRRVSTGERTWCVQNAPQLLLVQASPIATSTAPSTLTSSVAGAAPSHSGSVTVIRITVTRAIVSPGAINPQTVMGRTARSRWSIQKLARSMLWVAAFAALTDLWTSEISNKWHVCFEKDTFYH